MKKRLILLLIALVLLASVLTVSASAATEIYSSSVTANGANIKWKLYSDGALQITGTDKSCTRSEIVTFLYRALS